MNAKNLIIPLLLVLFCCILGCRNKQHNKVNENVRDLSQIKDSGELVVLTLYSSTSYFNYRGQEMGFQYELSEQFAKSMGLKLRIEVANSVDELIRKLLAGLPTTCLLQKNGKTVSSIAGKISLLIK